MYKHIIWDLDGTLFDTYPVMGLSFQETLTEIGIKEPYEEIVKYMKISVSHAFQHYEEKYHIDDIFKENYRIQRLHMELDTCKPFEGAEDICRYLQNSGRFNYLFTHRGESTLALLEKYNLQDSFTDMITSQDNFARKPSPEAISHLIEKYNMNPAETIMIGDRELDILSGKNAGISGCFISENGAKCEAADFTISHLEELYSIID